MCPPGSSNYDPWICVLDDAGNVLAENDDTCGLQSNVRIALDPGSFTVAVAGWAMSAGSYNLAYFASVPGVPSRSCNGRMLRTRDPIHPTQEVQMIAGVVAQNLGQVFPVSVCEAGSYTFTFCPPDGDAPWDPWLCLFDEERALIVENDDSCSTQSEIAAELTPGTYSIAVSGFGGSFGGFTLAYYASVVNGCAEPPAGGQLRGDCNQDGLRNLSDAVCLFGYLFLGDRERLACGDGTVSDPANTALLDHNGDGDVNLSDGIALLNYLFLGGPPPAGGEGCAFIAGCPELCPLE